MKKNRTICDSVSLVAAMNVAYCLKCTLGSPVPLNLAKFGNLKSSGSGSSLKSARLEKLLELWYPLSLKANSNLAILLAKSLTSLIDAGLVMLAILATGCCGVLKAQ